MFEVRVNGETVFKTESQVIGVALQSARGEMYKAGISNEGVVDVILETVQSGGPMRLDQLEAAQSRFREAIVSGQIAGNTPTQVDASMNLRQSAQDNTLREGDVDPNISQSGSYPPPAKDLAQGLDPRDSEALTKRLEDYGRHGDADRAIADNPPTGVIPRTVGEGGVAGETQPVGQPTPEQTLQAENQQPGAPSPGVAVPPTGAGVLGPPPESTPQGQGQPEQQPGFNLGAPAPSEPSAAEREQGQQPGQQPGQGQPPA